MEEKIYKYTLVETFNRVSHAEKIAVLAVAGRSKTMQFLLPHRFDSYEKANAFCNEIELALPLPTTREKIIDFISQPQD